MSAAVRYRLQHGGSIIRCGPDTDKDDQGNVIATFDSIAVVQNPHANTVNEGKRFAYNYKSINQ